MIIKKIEIDNFRSYYKHNSFELTNGLNLIIGSNGDGKTTFYEALEWLFRTDKVNEMDTKYISKKRTEELDIEESDNVRVSMTYEHKGKIKVLEKVFRFTKALDEEISTSNYSFSLREENGVERIEKDGETYDNDLPVERLKFIMFKGEDKLDVLEQSNSLKYLLDDFSEVRDFDLYYEFMDYAKGKANKNFDKVQNQDKKNESEIKRNKQIEEREKDVQNDIDRELKIKEEELENSEKLLKNIEQSKESSKLLKAANSRISSLSSKRSEIASRIKEDYTIDLLDNMWILMGFGKIAEEYSEKISALDRKRRKLEKDYFAIAGAEKLIKKSQQQNFTPLPVHIPGQKIMQEMLDEEVCKICGRPASKHSEPWNFMLQRLEEYKESLKVNSNEDDDIEPYYQNDYIVELQKRETTLNDNLSSITKLRHVIFDRIALNNRLHNDIKKYDDNLEEEYKQKKYILAHADGLTEDQLLNNLDKINKWNEDKMNAENRIKTLKQQRSLSQERLDEALSKLHNLAEGTPANKYAQIAAIFEHITKAFKDAKEKNKDNLINNITDLSNYYLGKLNINDFKGTIKIIEKNGTGSAFLVNNDTVRIYNPNTALRTTYLMSILFAIGQLSSEKDKTEFPLIFDAPTSSFTETKENEFFRVIGSLGKQVIIVTKSFLRDGKNGEAILDMGRVNNIDGRIYQIAKKRPFDDKQLGTIQTVISKIK